MYQANELSYYPNKTTDGLDGVDCDHIADCDNCVFEKSNFKKAYPNLIVEASSKRTICADRFVAVSKYEAQKLEALLE